MPENTPSFAITENHDPKGNEYLTFSTCNSGLGLRMEIMPGMILGSGEPPKGKQWGPQRNFLEVNFFDTKTNKMIFPIEAGRYSIRASEIGEIDTTNREALEEVLAKYATSFSRVTHYKDFDDLKNQVFPDIEEKKRQKESLTEAIS